MVLRIFLCFILVQLSAYGQAFFSQQSGQLGLGNSSYGYGSLGGGVSFFDFDNDGWDDITLSQEEDRPVRFFKNNQGTFGEVFFNMDQNLGEVKAVTWVDFDNDGDNDFYISTRNQANQLFRNDGNMEFTDITLAAGLGGIIAKSWGASWGDYNNDGFLDLFQSIRTLDTDEYNLLYRNNGDGTFTNVTIAAGLDLTGSMTFCSAFIDYNRDGWQDIYLANDKIQYGNRLYRNDGDGTFTEVSSASGTDVFIDAMCTNVGDYNNDGWLDIYITNTYQGNVFFENNGDGTFTDIAMQNGTTMNSFAWGSVFLDAENDGDLDLYVSAEENSPSPNLWAAFYRNNGSGQYTIPSDAGFAGDDAESYGNAIGDIQNDGYPDIAVLNFEPDNMFLWRNDSPPTNNWLKVKLEGVESNRMGIGSLIEISVDGQPQYNYTLLGEGYLGQNSAWEFFGIGTASSVDYVRVKWLSGTEDLIENPPINSQLTIVEGEAAVLGVKQEGGIDLLLSPNPTSSKAYLSLKGTEGPAIVRVYDLSGALIREVAYPQTSVLDVGSYAPGVYLVQVVSGSAVFTKKLVVH